MRYCALLLATVLTGCASAPQQLPQAALLVSRCPEVHVGMTFDETAALLGEPVKKTLESANPMGTLIAYEFVGRSIVMFLDGKVYTATCMQAPQTYDRLGQ